MIVVMLALVSAWGQQVDSNGEVVYCPFPLDCAYRSDLDLQKAEIEAKVAKDRAALERAILRGDVVTRDEALRRLDDHQLIIASIETLARENKRRIDANEIEFRKGLVQVGQRVDVVEAVMEAGFERIELEMQALITTDLSLERQVVAMRCRGLFGVGGTIAFVDFEESLGVGGRAGLDCGSRNTGASFTLGASRFNDDSLTVGGRLFSYAKAGSERIVAFGPYVGGTVTEAQIRSASFDAGLGVRFTPLPFAEFDSANDGGIDLQIECGVRFTHPLGASTATALGSECGVSLQIRR